MITIHQTLHREDVERILFDGEQIELSAEVEAATARSFEFLGKFAADRIIYGINTGFGPMAQYRIDDGALTHLQYNIIRSHATGVGQPLPDRYVKAALLARLGTFVQARSGIHPEVIHLLAEFINRGIYPLIPEHGGVGASGDLVQLAHVALALIGEGEVHHSGKWKSAQEALHAEQLIPVKVHIREGLAITNGTSVMTGIGIVNLIDARRLLDWALLASVMMNEVAASYSDFMSAALNSVRRHRGQNETANIMRHIAKGSHCIRNREDALYNGNHNDTKRFEHKVQPYYSLRCVPQILGPVHDTIKNAMDVLIDELNSACDNPIIDADSQNVYHGGNFHGDYVSLEMDKLKIAVAKLAMLAERQLNYLCHDRINGILPPFVNLGTPGLNYGMQAAQFTATSTTAECQMLANPMYVHSIPCNNDNQDIVSMGTNSALIAKKVIENAYQVMAIHFIALVQAVDCLKIQEKLSPETRAAYVGIRNFIPAFADDAPIYPHITKMTEHLMSTKLNYCTR